MFEDWGVGLVCEQTPDGPDYIRFCDRHAWASLPAATPEHTGVCPGCHAEMENGRGAMRYRALNAKMGDGASA